MPITYKKPLQSKYKVILYDNFHMYHEEDDFRSEWGVFSTWEKALVECKRIVDDQLCRWYQPGMSPMSYIRCMELAERIQLFGQQTERKLITRSPGGTTHGNAAW